ncbi:MAG: ATP-binding cassette domain-containing protein [Clostridiales bacterium]|nr:ATP-binding cassette domain-containing protein [Clostridiales bacterium]
MDGREVIVKIRDLDKTYYSKYGKTHALKDINLDIYKGEIFGIIGLSGAGKSTLVRCINFLELPTKGEVIFDGLSLSSLTEKELRKARTSMGMIFQQFNLLAQRNALDNVCFPLEIAGVSRAKARERALELLELVGIADKAKSYPSQLSGGQQQRVAIARALATNPKILLCDEATSALDPNTTSSILELLRDINQKLGITIIIITHQMSVIERLCQRVAIIDKSYIAELGKVTDVFTNPQSEIAKELILSHGIKDISFTNERGRKLRIVFDGRSTYEPIISNIVLEAKAPVNILYADTRNIDGKAVGEMVIQLPEDELLSSNIIAYLKQININFMEVEENV